MHFRQAFGGVLFALVLLPFFASAQVGLNVDVESVVRAYFGETPVMVDIARCESKFRQYTDSGNPLYGGYQGKMVGIFQVYEDIHAAYAKGLGMDIYTTDGNMAYARLLYEREGTKPWISSFPCWGQDLVKEILPTDETDTDAATEVSGTVTINLSMGMEHPQVFLLQKILNEKGYLIATDGPGSPGNETQKFGLLTRAAVRKYQCAEHIACDGDEHTTGYGFVGARTRAALVSRTVAPPLPVETPSPISSEYTPEQQQQIKDLQAQILELTKVLQALLAQN
ncbi:MAG: peptidoglycan-binding domain-containing protein [Patescibacteria group bacterium]